MRPEPSAGIRKTHSFGIRKARHQLVESIGCSAERILNTTQNGFFLQIHTCPHGHIVGIRANPTSPHMNHSGIVCFSLLKGIILFDCVRLSNTSSWIGILKSTHGCRRSRGDLALRPLRFRKVINGSNDFLKRKTVGVSCGGSQVHRRRFQRKTFVGINKGLGQLWYDSLRQGRTCCRCIRASGIKSTEVSKARRWTGEVSLQVNNQISPKSQPS
mmetsp:Transcript_19578/g.45587  ORF Transcript_19578/g.45587 Transcript_19578/m.45587 type:complete len:215 (-) Transcript_19578:9-653(-)